ncbi:MAG: glycosyltransferase family 2 protein [Acidimicrobiaceae bacterium]|nr:glycosyltransferase family 2 protein [Acidimicrobiaceae bacterium]
MEQVPEATVIVINWNGLRYLDTCFKSLLNQEVEGGFEAILLDNSSADGSASHVRERWPAVRVVESGGNLGFAAGNNLGMRSARGRHIVLLNADTAVQPGWLRALIEAVETSPRIGAVTSKLVFMADPNEVQNAGSLLLSDGSGADRGFHERDHGQFDAREEVFGACGAAVLYRREMLEDVGMFDETFFNYYEDTDLNWRMRLRGWTVLYEPTAVVHHVHAGSSGEWSPFFIFHVDRNRLFMILKNAPPGMVLRTFARFAGLAAANAVRGSLSRMIRPPAALERVNQGAGRARIHLKVVASLLRHLPDLLRKRWSIRRRRSVPDSEIARWFYPRDMWLSR